MLIEEKILELIDKYQINVFDSLTNGIDTNAGLLGGKISLGMQKIIILMHTDQIIHWLMKQVLH